jgi:hypothetical protein
MTGRKEFERQAFSDDGMPAREYAQSLLDMNGNQRRELARLNAKCDALAARLAEAVHLLKGWSAYQASTELMAQTKALIRAADSAAEVQK